MHRRRPDTVQNVVHAIIPRNSIRELLSQSYSWANRLRRCFEISTSFNCSINVTMQNAASLKNNFMLYRSILNALIFNKPKNRFVNFWKADIDSVRLFLSYIFVLGKWRLSVEDGMLLRQESSSQLLRESRFAFVCVTQQILHVPLSIHISSINLSKNLLHAVGLEKA